MKISSFLAGAALLMFAGAAACGSEVNVGGGGLDQNCYDECIAGGRGDEACTEACTTSESGSGANGTGASGTGASGAGGDGAGGLDPDLVERNCFECLEDNASACPAQHAACADDLACTLLKKCPFECFDDEQCIQQCKQVVPDGVPLVTELVECMVCNGPPCFEDCVDSVVYEAYCQ